MELTPADIQLLYGKTFWLMETRAAKAPVPAKPPAAPALQETASAPPQSTPSSPQTPVPAPSVPAVSWQFQPLARLGVIMPEPHAALPQALELLHKMCAAIHVQPHELNVCYAQTVTIADIQAARVPFVLIFDPTTFPATTEVVHVHQQEIYRLPALTTLLADTAAKRHAWELMKLFKDRI